MEEVMSRPMLLCAWLCAIAFVVAANSAQAAGANTTFSYLSNTGNDATNNCASPATACQSFEHALAETANYGEIDCVNADYYGTNFTITQSVTIDCAGAVGSAQGAITINGAGIVVRLRNLTLNSLGTGAWGIDAKNVAARTASSPTTMLLTMLAGPISASSSSRRRTRNCSSATPS
jgi:hypothetical protein